jgi:hypothetical protein
MASKGTDKILERRRYSVTSQLPWPERQSSLWWARSKDKPLRLSLTIWILAEGVFVGYRHYLTYKKKVLFPFGHGLSYTQFEHSDLKLSGEIGKDSTVKVSVTVKNVGKVPGRDVVYVSHIGTRFIPD